MSDANPSDAAAPDADDVAAPGDDVAWLAPGARPAPAQALQRIRTLCEIYPDLFSAMFVIVATHPGVSREMLAQAVKQFRPDAEAYSVSDMVSLFVSIGTGARDAFESVQRTRKSAGRKAASLPWGNAKD